MVHTETKTEMLDGAASNGGMGGGGSTPSGRGLDFRRLLALAWPEVCVCACVCVSVFVCVFLLERAREN